MPKTRFAPSPTGYLHRGHIWSALCVSAVAFNRNAKIHLRIEDHDKFRCSEYFSDTIKKDLKWLGFEWGTESVQSERTEIYEKYFKFLVENNYTYNYYKTDMPKVMFRMARDEDDFAIKDALGQWTYQFSVVVDDFEEGIDLIVRGDDLKDSVEKQIALAKTLGREKMPEFIHHALLFASNGKKLSKRDGADGIRVLRENGISPKKVIADILKETIGRSVPSELTFKDAVSIVSDIVV